MQGNIPSLDDLSKLTVVQLRSFAHERNIKVPPLRKAELIQYIYGKLTTTINVLSSSRLVPFSQLQPCYADFTPYITMEKNRPPWFLHLLEEGWSVIPLPDFPTLHYQEEFFTWLESYNSAFSRYDSSTWQTTNLPLMFRGIIKNYFGHNEFQWAVRERCVPFFAELWNVSPEDLLCSFDGGCFLLPGDKVQGENFTAWFHTDQPRDYLSCCSIQGLVTLSDSGEKAGGLVILKGSHRLFSGYMERHPAAGLAFEMADMNDPELSRCSMVKVCAPPGHLVLWDSRLVHCNVPPVDNSYRMCLYVAMIPRSNATEKELQKRQELYYRSRQTNHWCYGKWFSSTPEHPYGRGKKYRKLTGLVPASLNELRARLIGFSSLMEASSEDKSPK